MKRENTDYKGTLVTHLAKINILEHSKNRANFSIDVPDMRHSEQQLREDLVFETRRSSKFLSQVSRAFASQIGQDSKFHNEP